MSTPLGPRLRKKRPFDSLEQEAFVNLWRANDLLAPMHEALFSGYGMTAQQYNVLRMLRGEFPKALSMSDIASRLITRSPDTTRLVDRLVAQGWAQRIIPEADRRAVHVTITKAGSNILKTMDKPLLDCHHNQLGHMSKADLRQLIALLDKVRHPHEQPEEALPSSDP